MNKKYFFGMICILIALVVLLYNKKSTSGIASSTSNETLHTQTNNSDHYLQSQEDKIKQVVKNANTSLQLYGKVVDQDNNPLSDVTVTYSIREVVNLGGWFDLNDTKHIMTTDQDGRFYVSHNKCSKIFIDKVEKIGYRASSLVGVSIDEMSSTLAHAFDSNQPVILMLVSESIPIIKDERIEEYYSVKWNEGSTRIPLGRDVGSIFVLAKRDKPSDSKRDFPWSIDVAMNGLDLIVKEVTTREKHSYNIAPTDGYQKSYHFESSKDTDAWKDGIENEFFFITKAGHYAKISVTLRASSDPMDDFDCRITLKVNRNGGRIFE
jgi:hypothetical protein